MTDTNVVFRTKAEPTEPVPEKPITQSASPALTLDVEPPFTEWQGEKGRPYLAEYFELSDLWSDAQGGFTPEIEAINSYLNSQIESGKIDNSAKSVRELMKSIEKEAGIEKTERMVNRLAKIAAYTEFLFKTKDL